MGVMGVMGLMGLMRLMGLMGLMGTGGSHKPPDCRGTAPRDNASLPTFAGGLRILVGAAVRPYI